MIERLQEVEPGVSPSSCSTYSGGAGPLPPKGAQTPLVEAVSCLYQEWVTGSFLWHCGLWLVVHKHSLQLPVWDGHGRHETVGMSKHARAPQHSLCPLSGGCRGQSVTVL